MAQTMNNNDWIEWNWTPEKPYPETLETKVFVKCNNGHDETNFKLSSPVSYWEYGDANYWDPLYKYYITHYRLA